MGVLPLKNSPHEDDRAPANSRKPYETPRLTKLGKLAKDDPRRLAFIDVELTKLR